MACLLAHYEIWWTARQYALIARWAGSPSGLMFRPLLQPEGFSCALAGGYAVVTSGEGVQIHGRSGTALPRPVSATTA